MQAFKTQKEAQVTQFTQILANFIGYAAKHLPYDVRGRLAEMAGEEQSPLGTVMYQAIRDDLNMAETLGRPLCQDTGVQQFFVQAGSGFPLINDIDACLRGAVRQATRQTPLRPNAVEVFDEKNTGDNTGVRVPWIDWEIVPDRSDVVIYNYMAGGGCSLPGTAKVFMPLEGYEAAVQYIFDQITSYGINACPPLLVGIGMAGSVEVAAKLSKKALLRPIGSRNPNARAADLETRLEAGLNALEIGPGGLGGRQSVLGVHIEQAARHPATLAVGLSTGCWAHRRSAIRFDEQLQYTVLTHADADLS